jgi:hypothetical protein
MMLYLISRTLAAINQYGRADMINTEMTITRGRDSPPTHFGKKRMFHRFDGTDTASRVAHQHVLKTNEAM